MSQAPHLVWFKRDLRVEDHRPLFEASRTGHPVLALYVYEPEIMGAPDFDSSHLIFIDQSLAELDRQLLQLGGRLTYRTGNLPGVFDELHVRHGGIAGLWSHEETGNALTYARDLRVAAWCRAHGVRWTEIPQHGVSRPHRSRDGWAERWTARMSEPLTPAPRELRVVPTIDAGQPQTPSNLGLPNSTKTLAQPGGESHGQRLLKTFLTQRGIDYRRAMSSPHAAWTGSSRISPYLTFGCLSIRQAYQRTRARQDEVAELTAAGVRLDPRWTRSLTAFESRLRWHCHFIQKLEDEPALESRNLSRAHDGLREGEFSDERFAAWREGRTGYPLVDACMRALHCGGWINFRMRAMLASFAAYHLWLHWQPTAVFLARHFLDYEPGIHYSQFQMQSGVTGINSIRIYSPARQLLDYDPAGVFVRRFVPELTRVPTAFLAEPHLMPAAMQAKADCRIGRDYPAPVVEHTTAYRRAKERIGAVRATPLARREAQRVWQRHGGRDRPLALRAGVMRQPQTKPRKAGLQSKLDERQIQLL